ncbi:UNVERIFIED_CONTAM: Pentatricopeptide repeat-containing protein [Sesamum calycinum]|uniref:Pentatricopeptide repeat-containing protein n=1 Tax=Sesamum calycinum TaxID=2727403 RepID=A0AAW2JGP0_9LAMI
MTLKILKSLVGWDDFEGFLFGVLSFPKVGTQTANCLRILSSTKLASLIMGLSVTPPVKKSNDQIKQKKQKQKNQVLECLGHGHMSKKNGLERAPGGRVERKYSFLAVLELKVEALMAEVRGDMGSGSVVEEMKTKCSTKWARYGGCIPAMLEALETVNDLDEALKPWERTLTNKERSILLQEQLGWERALEIFEWFKMKRCYEVNVIHYNIMFKILGKARQWCEVERLWGEMWKRGIKPINSTYGTLIDVYCKGGFRDLAIKWLELMNKSGMEPDEVTMGIVVQMYKKAGILRELKSFSRNGATPWWMSVEVL